MIVRIRSSVDPRGYVRVEVGQLPQVHSSLAVPTDEGLVTYQVSAVDMSGEEPLLHVGITEEDGADLIGHPVEARDAAMEPEL